jgi:hypothetical protein
MVSYLTDIDFSKVLLIILAILIISISIISIKFAVVRINNLESPPKPNLLEKPWDGNPIINPVTGKMSPVPTNNPNNPTTPDPVNSDTSDEFYKTAESLVNVGKFVGNLLKTMFTTPAMYELVGTTIGVKLLTRGIVYCIRLGVVQTFKYAAVKAGSFVSSVLLKLASKFGPKALSQLGITLTKDALGTLAEDATTFTTELADEIGVAAGEEAAEALVEAGAIAAASGLADVILGPVGAALEIFQVGGMIIDMFDPGDYKDLAENEQMFNFKGQAYGKLMKSLSQLIPSIQLRPISGPTDSIRKKNPDIYLKNMKDCYGNAIAHIIDSPEFVDALSIAFQSDNQIFSNDTKMQQFITDNINYEIVLKYCEEQLCYQHDGIPVRIDGNCSFKDYNSCFVSNTNYPNDPPEGEVYVEWDQDRGECSMTPTTVLDACVKKEVGKDNSHQDIKYSYDPTTGLCDIDQTYCQKRGGENFSVAGERKGNDGKPKNYPDCYVSAGQSFLETLFGKTIVRGIRRQV